jgi:hypothetical protein
MIDAARVANFGQLICVEEQQFGGLAGGNSAHSVGEPECASGCTADFLRRLAKSSSDAIIAPT